MRTTVHLLGALALLFEVSCGGANETGRTEDGHEHLAASESMDEENIMSSPEGLSVRRLDPTKADERCQKCGVVCTDIRPHIIGNHSRCNAAGIAHCPDAHGARHPWVYSYCDYSRGTGPTDAN